MKCSHPQLNYYKSPVGMWNVHCGTCCLFGPFVSRVEDAKEAFLSRERIESYKNLYHWFESVDFKNIQDIIRPEVDSVDFYRQLGASFEIKYIPIEEAKRKFPMPNPTPYWIIVSDEGHAATPAKHLTKEAADAEAKRLTAAKPGVNFTVFEAKYSLKTPKAEAVKTTYERAHEPRTASEVVYSSPYFGYPYGKSYWLY